MFRVRFAIGLAILIAMLVPELARADEKAECAQAGNDAGPLRSSGKLKDARDRLIRCSQATCPAVIRDNCASDLKDLAAELPSIVLRATDASGKDLVHVHVDARGAPMTDTLDGSAIVVDPGPLKLSFSAEGYKPQDLEVVIARGEKDRIVKVALEDVHGKPSDAPPLSNGPAPSASSSSAGAGPWVLLSIGGAGLIAFAALEGVAQMDYSKLKAGCGAMHSCKEADVAPTRAKFIGAGVALGVGGAFTAAAVTWWIVHAATGPKVAIGVGPASAKLRVSF